MSKVKLDLQAKDFTQIGNFAKAHAEAMLGNLAYPTPVPSAMSFDTDLGLYEENENQIIAKQTELTVLLTQRRTLRAKLETALNERGDYVQTTSEGDAALIQSAGFEVQAERTTTTSIDKPEGVYATMGDNEGEIDTGCHAVSDAKNYIYEKREHTDVTVPGPWTQWKVSTRSSATAGGLVSGSKYGFRMRALGTHDLESPWSAEVICMAP